MRPDMDEAVGWTKPRDQDPSVLVRPLGDRLGLPVHEVLAAIGGGWVPCNVTVECQGWPDHDVSWFQVGEPVLAVLGLASDSLRILEVSEVPPGLGGPPRLEMITGVELETSTLLDEAGRATIAAELKEIISRARRRLFVCPGCREHVLRSDAVDVHDLRVCRGCAAVYSGLISC